jgi:biopolymer transport protein ExbD
VAVKQISADSQVAPNLVPMVDVMFLLLLFFMLVSDMSQRELEEVVLPIASSVKEDKATPQEQRLMINVHHAEERCADYGEPGAICRVDDHWKIAIRGNNYNDPEALKSELLKQVEIEREKKGETVVAEAGKLKTPSELKVMIRADGASLYSHVQRAMNACGEAGIYKIEIGAAQKPPE